MSISSLFVVTNSLRINRFKSKEIKGEKEMNETKLYIPNMNCMHCVARINEALQKLKDLENVNIELETKTVTFTCKNPKDEKKAINAIKKAGYEVK